MSIDYRDMRPDEAKETMALCRRVFPFWYRLFIWGFKDAVVAVDSGRIVGGASWHVIKTKRGGFGYLDFGFTDKNYRGRGIGRETYTRVMNKFKEAGLDSAGAIVLSDNTASWTLFADNGCSRSTTGGLIRQYGFFGALKIWFETALVFAPGGELWKTGAAPEPRLTSALSIIVFLLANCALALLTGLRQGSCPDLTTTGLVAAFMLLRLFIIRLFIGKTEMPLRFSFWKGGMMLPLIVLLAGGLFPLGGDYYPSAEKWGYRSFCKKAGLGGFGSWLSVLAAAAGLLSVKYLKPELTPVFKGIFQWIYMMLIFHMLPFLLESWPGARVLRWSRGLFTVLTVLSGVILVLLFL